MRKKEQSDNRAVDYARVSTEDQQTYSIPSQLAKCHAYADDPKVGLIIIRDFKEAASGWKANARVEFYKMLDFIEKEKIPNLIYAYGDRLSRNTEDYVKLKATGVTLHDATTGKVFNPSNPDDYDQTAAFEVEQAYNKHFSAKNRKRVMDAHVRIISLGFWPHSLPIGLKRGPEISQEAKDRGERRLIEFETEGDRAGLVLQLFKHWATGEYTRESIKAKAKEIGLRSRSGRVLSVSYVEGILRDIKYTGRYFDWEGVRHEWKENAPALIPWDLWEEAQEVFNRKKRRAFRTGEDYKYYKLLTCDLCGCDIIQDPQKKTLASGETKVYPYYRCTGGKSKEWYQAHFGKPKCPMYYGPYWLESEIDEYFALAIESLYVDPDTYEWVKSQIEDDYKNLKDLAAQEIKSLGAQLLTNDDMASMMSQRAAKAKNPLVQARYEAEIENLERQKLEMQARLKDLETGESAISLEDIGETLELSKSLKDKYLEASPEKRKRLHKLMFRTVRVTRRELTATPDFTPEGEVIAPTVSPFYFVWNEPFKSLWEIGFIQNMAEVTGLRTAAQKAHKPGLKIKERA